MLRRAFPTWQCRHAWTRSISQKGQWCIFETLEWLLSSNMSFISMANAEWSFTDCEVTVVLIERYEVHGHDGVFTAELRSSRTDESRSSVKNVGESDGVEA